MSDCPKGGTHNFEPQEGKDLYSLTQFQCKKCKLITFGKKKAEEPKTSYHIKR